MSSLAQIEKVMLLRGADLFAHCKAEEVVRIAAIAREQRFSTGERIYERNDPAKTLFCVVDGEVALGGDDSRPARALRGDTFGVTEILSGRLRSQSATATAATVALAIDADDFFDLLSNNIDIVRALFREILSDRQTREGGSHAND